MNPEANVRPSRLLDAVTGLVTSGLKQHELSGITAMLACVAKELNAFGAVLWELNVSGPLQVDPCFFPLAQSFSGSEFWYERNVPLASRTGLAVTENLSHYHILDVTKDTLAYRAPFLKDQKIRTILIIPVTFMDGARGALNIFRREVPNPFSEEEIETACRMAKLIPDLYERIRDEVGYRLSREVNNSLQRASVRGAGSSGGEAGLDETMINVSNVIRRLLMCEEVSVFLSVPDLENTHRLYGFASASNQAPPPDPAPQDPIWKALSGPVRYLDLRHLTSDPEIEAALKHYFVWLTGDENQRPLSFMAAPILVGGSAAGVIRCCAPLFGPSYFAEREAYLLVLLAGQIGQYVSDQRSRWALDLENADWRVLVESVSTIITLVHEELNRAMPDENQIYSSSVQMISKVIPGATFVDVRVKNSETGLFEFKSGQGWPNIPQRPVALPALWVAQLEKGDALIFRSADLKSADSPKYSQTVPPETLILAPIQSNDHFGVLEIGHVGPEPFPKHARTIAKLLGSQLSLYHSLSITIGKLTQTQAELKKRVDAEKDSARAQAQTFMDLEHQIKNPLRHARTRIPVLLRLSESLEGDGILKQLLFLRGIIRRASRVAGSIGLFAELASNQPVLLQKKIISISDLKKLLIEAAMDNQLIVDEQKALTFGVSEETFAALARAGKVELDRNLLDQAINNLLDNAAKYGYEGTKVQVTAALTKNRLVIAVVNKGLRLGPSDVEDSKTRGWRSPLAKVTTGEGSGIGLWIVNHIMMAHGGELIVVPTTPEGYTEVRLQFPIGRP